MSDTIELDSFVDPALGWELAQVQNAAYDEVEILRKQLPQGYFRSFLHKADVARINNEIEDIGANAEAQLASVDEVITGNRQHVDHVRFYFDSSDREAYASYYDSYGGYPEFFNLRDRNSARLGYMRSVGTMYQGEPGSHTITLFDSSVPERQMHGMAVGSTLQALGFSKEQFRDKTKIDAHGTLTTSATIQPGVNVLEGEQVPSVGRNITATYIQTDKDAKVEITIDVGPEAPVVTIPLPETLEKILWSESEYACGSIWYGNGYEGIGESGMTSAIQRTQEFRAFGGQLTKDQQSAFEAMRRYRDYLSRSYR